MVAPGREARVGIKFLIGSAYGNDRDVSEEALIHGDIEFLDCLEGGGYRRSVVAACKLLAWYRVATDTQALYYGKVEDDHFVAVRALAADLRGLAGHARRGPLAYGLLQWLSYDGRRFWDARSDAWENATERAAALELRVLSHREGEVLGRRRRHVRREPAAREAPTVIHSPTAGA